MKSMTLPSLLLVIITLLSPRDLIPQTAGSAGVSVSGTIVDAEEGLPFKTAHIWAHQDNGQTSFEAAADRQGHFSLNLPDGYYFVLIGTPSYLPVSRHIRVESGKPIRMSIRLHVDHQFLTD